METAEEEHEQDVVTSTSSPNSVIDNLDSKLIFDLLIKTICFDE